MLKSILLSFLISYSLATHSQQSSLTRESKINIDIKLNYDGSYEKLIETQFKISSKQEQVEFSKMNFAYVLNHESIDLIEASIIKKDNKVIQIDFNNNEIENIQTQGVDSHRFKIASKAIFFENLQIGDTVRYKLRKFMIIPSLKNHFYFEINLPYHNATEEIQISLTLPGDLRIAVESKNIAETIYSPTRLQKKFVWTPSVQSSGTQIGQNIHLIVSTIRTYEELANIYKLNSKEKSTVTKKIKILADMLARNSTNDGDKAKFIYQWVQKNISYKSPGQDINMIIPNSSEIILDRRYGDCKDFVVILESLLSAVEIESTPVLINTTSDANLPIIPGPKSFNHVITYIPSLDLYLDSTSEDAPFGQLPKIERSKPAIHVKNFVKVMRTQNF